jgi:hypothetical protein
MVGRLSVILAAGALVSCSSSSGSGSSSGDNSCGVVAPCGGNVVGTWKASDVCISGATKTVMMGTGCTATTSASPSVSGTATFNSDGTFTSTTAIVITTTIDIPAACLAQLGGAGCAELATFISASEGDAGATAACSTATGGGCTCIVVDNGGAVASADPTGGSAPSVDSYCVASGGSQLHLISSSTDVGVDGGPTAATADVVLTK